MEYLEDQIRQLLGGVVWTHKIQEKQADIYLEKYNRYEFWRIILQVITTSGIISTIFANFMFTKIISAIFSAISLYITTYLKSYDLKELHRKHKETALMLLTLREEIISIICEIRLKKFTEDTLIQKRDKVNEKYLEICKTALDATEEAVNRADVALKQQNDSNYEDEEIDKFLPMTLRKNKKEIKC